MGYEAEKSTDLRSGKDGSLLQGFAYSDMEVEVFGDWDRDGRPNFALHRGASLEVISGKTGQPLVEKSNDMPTSEGWWVGDHSGEGLLDFLWIGERAHKFRLLRGISG